MKKILFFTVFLLINLLYSQENTQVHRWELSLGYKMGVPMGDLGFYIQRGHGMLFQILFKPTQKFPLWIGGNADYIIYGSKTTPQQYVFPDNSVANVDVDVNSSIFVYQLALKYPFLNKSLFEPYLMLRMGGTSFDTNLYIEDPRYDDECVALEQEHLHNSKTYSITPSIGSKIYFNKKQHTFLDFNVGYTAGGEVTFMNPTLGENMTSVNHQNHATGDSDAQPYYVDFINRRTQVVHKHHVGNVYQSTFQMLNLRLGLGITL